MSDNPLLAFAIGSLAASRGASERARLAADIITPRRPEPVRISADTSALIQALQEQEQHIVQQDAYIEDLRRATRELREVLARVQAERNALREWADWAEPELRRRAGEE